jgi:probable F420-dependent oxidoreductase
VAGRAGDSYSPAVHVGLFVPASTPGATPTSLGALAGGAEARGFRSLWVPEHVIAFDREPPAGRPRVLGGEAGTLDPFVLLGFLAAVTSTIRLGTGVTLVSQRQPLFAAKEAATVDHLSGGRLDLGVGVGWIRQEFEALGLRREDRGRLADRNLEIMRTLWVDDVSEYHSHGYDLGPSRAYPKPVQLPHPPVHVGGHSDAALQRVARYGQGWYAFDLDAGEFGARMHALDRVLADHGRARDELQVSVCPYLRPFDFDELRRYRDAGAGQVILLALADPARPTELLDRYEADYVDPARGL